MFDLATSYKLLEGYICRCGFLFALLLSAFVFHTSLNAQVNASKVDQSYSRFGYTDMGDSVEFVFGQQQKIKVGGVEILMEKRINEITQVNVAGDFNGWNPQASKYQMIKVDGKLFKIRISKINLGKKGELRQFKFVLNHQYWVEPPVEALNKLKGADGNTNLTLKL
jgi:hypothetical protein